MNQVFTVIGNACTDLLTSVNDDFLQKYSVPKGLCRFITDFNLLSSIKTEMGDYQSIPGGAGANVAHVVSALGAPAHFISKAANDAEGISFKRHMTENGVECHFPETTKKDGSSQVLTFITPDSERTFLSFDDVAIGFSADDYDFGLLNTTQYLYLDGYCMVSPHTREGFIKAAEAVRKNGGHVTFNIGDVGYFTTKRETVDEIINACDSMICNADEATTIFGKQKTIQEIAIIMSQKFLFGAITDGKNGATVFYNQQIAHVDAVTVPPENVKDTNGAGDHFSGGFIYGLMNGFTLEQSAKLGILCATDCVQHAGARPLGGRGSLKHLADLAKN